MDNLFQIYEIKDPSNAPNTFKAGKYLTIIYFVCTEHNGEEYLLNVQTKMESVEEGSRLLIIDTSTCSLNMKITGFYHKGFPGDLHDLDYQEYWIAETSTNRYDSIEFMALRDGYYVTNTNGFTIVPRV